ncbi:MAG: response regulator [Bdellovibrionota bacterium]
MNILIVDDEPLVRKSLGRAFKARGHEVAEAVDGNEGLKLWLSSSPDVVFVDVLMPGLSGPELLREVMPKLGSSWTGKVILMSAYSGEHNVATAQQMGADLFIPKPFDDIFALVSKAEELFGR